MEIRQTYLPVLATFCFQVGTVLGGIALAILLGRIGGAAELGRFTVMLSLIGALSMLARQGQASLLTRAASWASRKGGKFKPVGLLWIAIRRTIFPSLALGVFGSILLWSGTLGVPYQDAVYALPATLILYTSLSIFSGYVRGTSRPWLGPIFEIGGVSLVTVILLQGIALALPPLSSAQVTPMFLASMVLLAVAAFFIVFRDCSVSGNFHKWHPTDEEKNELKHGRLEFTIIALGIYLIQSGSFVIAAPFLSDTELGLLRAAERLALIVSFPVLVINPVIVSKIVPAARTGNYRKLRLLIGGAVVSIGCISAPVLLILLNMPELALSLLGSEFIAAREYLMVMAVAQFIAAMLGPFAMLLNMSGRERASMWINLATLLLAFVSIPIFCIKFGASGFVFAYCLIILLRLILTGWVVASGGGRPGSLWD